MTSSLSSMKATISTCHLRPLGLPQSGCIFRTNSLQFVNPVRRNPTVDFRTLAFAASVGQRFQRNWIKILQKRIVSSGLSLEALTMALAILLSISIPGAVCAGGLPEPGLIMFGLVANMDGSPITFGGVTWQVSSTLSSLSVTPAIININNQNFYITTVPFETHIIGGNIIGVATPNTLDLNSTPTTYSRFATVNGTNAAIVYASSGMTNTFTFGPTDRGRIERVDLAVSPPLTFVQWLEYYGLSTNSCQNCPTSKGMTLMQQFIAGLNPTNANSLFQFVGIQPGASGIQVQRSSVANETYTLQQGISLNGPFTAVQSNIVGTPGTNTFTIPMPTNSATLFLRVVVNP